MSSKRTLKWQLMLHEPVWRPKILDAVHGCDVMNWGHSHHDQTQLWDNIKTEIHSCIVSKKPEVLYWQTTSTTETLFTNLPLLPQLFYISTNTARSDPREITLSQLWWEVTVDALLPLLWEQIGWMLLVPDKEHPDWFLTDRTDGNRKMEKPAQSSLIHRPLVTR